jgi:TRAP-type C4-dicarboxylate transport system substrate-binding protein
LNARVRTALRCLLPALLAASSLNAFAKPAYTLKFATLVPKGTVWMNILEDWARTVEERSDGQLLFKFYPGGIQGDEPDVLKKMRFGQLHGGAFTGYGIGHIYSPARVMELPFLFENYAEIDQVRTQLLPGFAEGFRENGYELLGWTEIGFIHFFSQKPIASLDDLRQRRIWMWQGDPLSDAWFRAADVSPVPLSIADVYTSLSTGLIDTVYSTPAATVALQWFTKTQYMTNVPMANGIGALVVSRTFFKSLPEELQALLKETGKETAQRLIDMTRADTEKSIEVLKAEGIQLVMDREDIDPQELQQISDRAAAQLTDSGYISEALLDKTRVMLKTIRGHTTSAAPAP